MKDLEKDFLDKINLMEDIQYARFQQVILSNKSNVAVMQKIPKKYETVRFQDYDFKVKIKTSDDYSKHVHTMMSFLKDMKKQDEYRDETIYPLFAIIYKNGDVKHGTLLQAHPQPPLNDLYLYVKEHDDINKISHVLVGNEAMSHKCSTSNSKTHACTCNKDVEYQNSLIINCMNKEQPEKSFLVSNEMIITESEVQFLKTVDIIPLTKSKQMGTWEGEEKADISRRKGV